MTKLTKLFLIVHASVCNNNSMQPTFRPTTAWMIPAIATYALSAFHLTLMGGDRDPWWDLFVLLFLPKLLYAPAIVWYVRTLANAAPLGRYERITSPTWAILVLFIPLINWIMPYYWLHDAYQYSF